MSSKENTVLGLFSNSVDRLEQWNLYNAMYQKVFTCDLNTVDKSWIIDKHIIKNR